MDKNKKSKTFNKMSIRKGISLSLAALTLAGPIVPYAVYANPTAAVQDTMKKAPAKAPAAYPTNIVDKINWDAKESASEDYWILNQQLGVEPTQKIVRVTTSDPIEIVDINYQGYFVDADGRTNLRLVYNEKSAAISAVWKKALLRFDKDLYDSIDFDKSFGIAENGKTYALNASNGVNERSLDVAAMISNRTQNRNNLPINLVLKEGKTFQSLGNKNFKIQMRLVDKDSKRIYAFAPGKSSVDYSTYTKQTVIPVADNIDGLFLRGPKEEDGKKFAMQRSFMSEFIANPEGYTDTSNLGILRTEYQAERDSSNPKDVKDGKPAGFIQAFDAELVQYFKEDAAGNIAYTNMLNADRTEVKNVGKVGIKRENINYSADKKIAYIVFGQSNFVKDGVSVVSLDKFDGKINQGGFYFTSVDYVIDKTKLEETFQTTGTTKVDFNIMTGWAETNPTGWTIFEKEYPNGFNVDREESFMIDTTQDPTRKQIMIQAGDPEEALIRTMQGYYAGHKDLSTGFEKIERLGEGIYEFNLREGATIEQGEKFRVIIPDEADHTGPVNFLETHNGSKYNQGAAKLKLQADRNINMHLYRKDKGSFKVYYTLKGETEQKVLEFTKGALWKYKDTDKILDGIPNKAVDPSGGNFWINTKKLEPGKDIIVEAYNAAGEKEENLTSWFKYVALDKSAEKYTRMAWVDHAETLATVGIDKSAYVPYQEIFTNDYKTGTDEIYKDPRLVPADGEDFMAKTGKIEGFTQYDGGKIRMRYIAKGGATYVGKTEAAANEYDDKGEVKGTDYSQKVTVNSKEYDAMPYELDLAQVSELKDADPTTGTGLELKKDMRLIFNASNGSSLPSDWYDTRVKTRVLFDATDGQFEDTSKKAVKVVPDNVNYYQEEGYTANGFTGANVKAGTGDEFAKNPTADGKTFLGWVTEEGKTELGATIVKAEVFDKLDATKKFTAETPVDSHKVVYAIWSEEKLITFDANGGKFADGSTTKTDDLSDGVTAPAEPTQDGKTFAGWASKPDATEADVIDVTTLTEATTVYAVWKDGATEKTADKVQPEYTGADAQAGQPTTITAPNFTDNDGKDVPVPAETKFALGKDAPAGATINPDTGEITYTPTADDAGKPVEIPVVVTYKDGSKDEVKATVTVAPEQGLTIKEPTTKVPVENKNALTDEEKQAVKDAIKAANPDLSLTDDDITVDEKGNVTVNKDGKTGTLPADKVVEEKQGLTIKEPTTKVPVENKNALTDEEKQAVKDAIKAANPDLNLTDDDITVDEKGNVTVNKDGKTGTLPADKVVEEKQGLTIKEPTTKVPVENKNALTDEEKQAVKDAIKAANPDLNLTDDDITVDEKGNVTVNKDGKTGTLPADKVVEEKQGLTIKEPTTKVPVENKNALTDEEKQAVKDAIKAANPDLNLTDDDITVDEKGNVTVNKDGKTGTLPADKVVEEKQGLTIKEPTTKVPVENKNALTDEEKQAVKDAIKAANPDLNLTDDDITVDEKGNVTVNKDGKTGTLPADKVVEEKQGLTIKEPTTKVPVENKNALTDEEKQAVKDAIKAANPDLSLTDDDITVDEKGNVTVNKDGKTGTLPADKVVEEKQGLTIKEPTTKVPVENKNALTDEEKQAVKDAIKAANPDLNLTDDDITVDEKGNVTVNKDGKTGTLPADKVVEEKQGLTIKEPTTKVPVENKNALTDEEKQAVKDAIKAANPDLNLTDDDITVDEKGNVTVNKDGKTGTLPADKVVEEKQGLTIKEPTTKVPVENKNALTDEEKQAVKDAIKAANPDLNLTDDDITVDEKGNVTVNKDGKTGTLPADKVVEEKQGLTIKEPTTKVPVENKNALTDEEKQAVKDAIKAANPDLNLTDDDITVDEKGNVTVNKDGKTGTLPADKVVEEKQGLTIKEPTTKVPVENKNALTDEEKQAVKDAIKAANPDLNLTDDDITVDEKGNVTVNKDGKTGTLPADKVVEEKQGLTIKEPTTKVPVENKNALTDEEKQAVKDAIKAANPDLNLTDDDITVDEKGNVTVNKDGKTGTLPADKVVEEKQGLTIKEPTTKVPVENKNALTDEEKQAVKDAIKAANPDLNLTDDDITVDEKGNVTVNKDGKTGTLPADKVVEEKLAAPTVKANKDGSVTITPPANVDIDSIHIEYTDENNQQGTLVVTKDPQGNWTLPQGTDPSITVDPETGIVTIPADQVADGTVVTAFVQKGNDSSDEAKATANAPEENKSDKPTINPVKVGDTNITGTAQPNAVVNVTYPNGDETETRADGRGNWSVDAPAAGLAEGQTITATATEDGKAPSDPEKATVKGNTPAVDDQTTIDDSNSKPVEPTNKNQGTGIIVNNPQGSTITAEDEDGRNVPVSIDPITGEIVVYPGSDVDGPIKVTITDKNGNVRVIYIDVIGHAMCRDDNRNGYVGDRDNYWFLPGIIRRHDRVETHPVYAVVPEKTTVGTPVHDTLWYVFHINEYEYEVVRNGVVTKRIMDVTPVIQNDRTMLPLRYVAEAIGAEVEWDNSTRTARFTKNGLTASIQIDGNEIVLSNGKTIKMDSKPLNIKDRILVSVTNVANVFGMTNGNTLDGSDQDIEWNQNDKSATIYIRR